MSIGKYPSTENLGSLSEIKPVWIFDDRYWSKPVRLDRTDRPATYWSTGDR